MMHQPTTRRRFLGITAAAAGLSLLPFGRRVKADATLVSWQGMALGAEAMLQIHHPNEAAARELIARCLDELRRLEQQFSLYRQNSALAELNRRGVLEAPSAAFVELLDRCRDCHALTNGMFDPTVQSLWRLYARHFGAPEAQAKEPNSEDLQAALSKIGFGHVLISRDRVALGKRGMALTLNGIAQGFITDRIVALLQERGVTHSLVNMGEHRVIGSRLDGLPWEAGISDPSGGKPTVTVPLINQAIATSGGYGFSFDKQGRFNHLLDPRTGSSAERYRSISVVLPTATAADALSTAFSLMSTDEIAATLRLLGHGDAYLVSQDGRMAKLSA